MTGYSPENFLHNFISSHSLQQPSECNAVTLRIEVACYFEMLVHGYYRTQYSKPEDCCMRDNFHESLKTYKPVITVSECSIEFKYHCICSFFQKRSLMHHFKIILSSPQNVVNGRYNAAIFQNWNSFAKCDMVVKLNLKESKYVRRKFWQDVSMQLVS